MNLLLRSATLMLANSSSPELWAEVVRCSRLISPAPHSQISLLT